MSYQVTARKWRPQKFSDMVGQEHIARTLRNTIASGRIAHAYLFVGPRGIGKTTSARIFAKALNCKHPVDGEPCCECSSCKAIAEESSVDVIEIDAATHTQVEKAREICEDVLHLPISSKYKIYIIDEVHMLSKSAWNALLKTIEEPPAHAKFIFATTEVNKVLPTVISRCQRFDLSRIPAELITKRLAYIAQQEQIRISQEALHVIARAADGGMRDAQSLLDQLVSFFGTEDGSETISESQALSLFGLTAPGEMEALVRNILLNDKASVIFSIHQFAAQGKNLETLYDEILVWLRGILMTGLLQDPGPVLDESPEKLASYRLLADTASAETIQILMEQMAASSYMLREAINKQVFMETILLKSMRGAHAVRVEDLLARLNQIRKNGELDGIEKIPSTQFCPVRETVKNIPPVIAPEPLPEVQSRSVAANDPSPVPEEPVAAVSVTTEQTNSVTKEEAQKEIPQKPESNKVTNDETVTEQSVTSPAETTSAPEENSIPDREANSPDLREEESEESNTEADCLSCTEELAVPEEDPEEEHSMGLQERFSAANLWQKLMDSVALKRFSLSALMQSGFPDRIENRTLFVAFDEKARIQDKELLEESKDFLLNELRLVTGDRTAVLSLFLRKGLLSEEKPGKQLEELKREASGNPMVRETQELFAGIIVDVFE